MKTLKKIGIIVLIVILTIVPLVYGIAYFFRDDIKAYAIEELNNQLATKMTIDGIDFSLFSAFPNVSLKLTNVKLEESNNVTGENMIEADEILLVFNIVKVLQQEFKFYKLVIKDAKLNLCVGKDGKVNYDILKKAEEGKNKPDEEQKPVEVDFEAIELVNTSVSYSNKQNNQGYYTHFDDAALKGNFKETAYTMAVNGRGKVLALKIDGQEYLKEKSLKINSRLNVTDNIYQFDKSTFTINGLDFSALGNFIVEDEVKVDVNLKGEKMTIQSFLSLLPNDVAQQMNDLGSEGDFYFNAKLTGSTGDTYGPLLKADFGVSNGTIKKKEMQVALTDVDTKGEYKGNTGNLKESELYLNNITALLNDRRVSGDVRVLGLSNPKLIIRAFGELSLPDVKQLVGIEEIESISGLLDFDVSLAGRADDFTSAEGFTRVSSMGEASFKNIGFKVADNHLQYTDVSGSVKLKQGNVLVKEIIGKVAGNEVSYTGEIVNLLPYILKDNQRMLVKGKMVAENLSINSLLPPVSEPTTNSNGEVNATSNDNALANLPDDIKFALIFEVGKLTYDEFNAEKVKGKLAFTKDYFDIRDVSLLSSGGSWYFKADLRPVNDNEYITTAKVTCDDVDIRELFRQFNNFGQEAMTYENLKGRLSSREISFACIYDKQFNANLDDLYTYAKVKLEDGQLINFEPMMGLSNHIKVEELRDIKFSTIENTIEIKNQTIAIPNMQINNSALNIGVSGTHTFENFLDYKFKIKMSDYLSKKYNFRSKLNKEDFEETNDGQVYLYVFMKGHIDNLIYNYDKKAVKEKMKQSIVEEKQVAKKVLKDEINFILGRDKDTSIDNSLPEELDENEYEWDE